MSKLSRREALALGAVIVVFAITLIWTLVRVAQGATAPGVTLREMAPVRQEDTAGIRSGAPPSGEAGQATASGADSGEPSPQTSDRTTLSSSSSAEVVVHVAGAVRHPGVYHLSAGARNDDAVRKAGGPTADANTDAINLAAHVEDGTQLYLPTRQQHPEGGADASTVTTHTGTPNSTSRASSHTTSHTSRSTHESASSGRGDKLTDPSQGTVNINTASVQELQRLPGIGPSMAERIVAYRKELQRQGSRFQSPDDLREVSGIGEKKFAKLAPFLRIN